MKSWGRYLFLRIFLPGLAIGGLGLCSALAGEESVGALFLNEPVGARPAAMGEAFVAVAEDANAVFWNPAGLVRIRRQELLVTHTQSFQGSRNEYLALELPWSENDALAVNGLFAYSDSFDKYTDDGTPAGSFSLYDTYLGISWSHALNSRYSAGLTLKGIYQTIDAYHAWSVAADLSFLWFQALPDLNLGLVVKNLGKPIVFIEKNHVLDMAITAGAGYRFWDKNLLLTFAMDKPFFQEMNFKLGAEYNIQDLVALRAGYKYLQFGNDLGALSGLTLGLGLHLSDYSLDYAYAPFADLGDVHRIALILPLGRSVADEQQLLKKLEKQVKDKQKIIFDQTVAEGDQWMAKQNYAKALTAYARAYGMNPNDVGLNHKIQAAEQAQKKKAAEEYAALGKKALQEKDYLTALVEGSKLLEIFPQDAFASQLVAEANRKLSEEKLAAEGNSNRLLINQYFQQGLQYLQKERYGEALGLWKKILALDPHNSHVTQYLRSTQTKMEEVINELLRLADSDWENEQYLEAVKKWRQVLDISDRQPQALARLEANKTKMNELVDQYNQQGVQAYVQNELRAAMRAWENVLWLEPKNIKALEHLEHAKKKSKELEAIK